MSDDARENDKRDKAPTGEAALSARLKRLGERLAQEEKRRSSDGYGLDRGMPPSGFAKGLRLASEFVAGVVVGAGLGLLIDRVFGSSPWGLIGFLLLGFAASVLNLIRSAGAARDGAGEDAGNEARDGGEKQDD